MHRLLQLVHPLIGLVALVGCGLAPNLAGHPEIVDNDRRAAAHGSPENQYHLGLRYFGGRGVTKDEAEAVKWFRKAADQGHLGAQYMLGVAYSAGQGVAQDGSESVKWLAKAAEEGHPRAQYLLGDAYLNGRAVARDPAWAGRWFGKAAYQGVAEAQYSLGVVFAAGLGVPRNRRVAWQWLTLAQRAGHPDAGRLRNAVEPGLSEKQMRIAGQWVARYSPARGAAYADDPTVRYVQFSLDVLGYSVGSIDGVIGERTRAAIQRYQADVGLSDRARIGPALLARLRMDARQAAPPEYCASGLLSGHFIYRKQKLEPILAGSDMSPTTAAGFSRVLTAHLVGSRGKSMSRLEFCAVAHSGLAIPQQGFRILT